MHVDTAYLLSAFDLVNGADVDVVRQAAAQRDRLEARVLSDDAVRAWSGKDPVIPALERIEIVGSLREVADVALFDPTDVLRRGPRDVVFARSGVGVGAETVDRFLTPRPVPIDDWVSTVPARSGGVLGYVPGAWDCFHVGHLNILRRARQLCDQLVVGVVTDEELFAAKGKLPMVPLDERVQVVAAVGIVDAVVVDFSTSKLDVWERVGFDVLFKGDDWLGTDKGQRLEREMESVGASVRYFPYTQHTSSTVLRQILAGR